MRALYCFVILIAVVPAQGADVVYRKSSDTPLQGTISRISKTGISVKKRVGKPDSVQANDIDRIRWNAEPPKLNLARTAEANGRLQEALEDYQDIAKKVGANKESLGDDLQFLIARTIAKIAEADPTRLEEAVRKLESFQRAHPDHFRHFEVWRHLSRLQTLRGDDAAAEQTFVKLAGAPWPDYKLAADIGRARLLLQKDQLGPALDAFNKVLAAQAKTPAELSRRNEALLGKATCLHRQQKFEEALRDLTEVTEQAAAEDIALQAEAYVRQGDCLQALGRPRPALLAYLHVHLLFAREKALHAESLFHLVQLWREVGKPERAEEARDTLESEYPNSEWTEKLASTSSG